MARKASRRYIAPAIATAAIATALLLFPNSPGGREMAEQDATQQSSPLEQEAEKVAAADTATNTDNSETRQYHVQSLFGKGLIDSTGRVAFGKTEYLEIEGNRIAYSQRTIVSYGMEGGQKNTTEYILVPGIVASEEYKTEQGASVVDVRPISDPQLREKIREELGTKKGVTFWGK